MKIAHSFLEKLLTKLKSGDARSIHLNALPGNFARLDIYDLINIEQSLHLKFLELLFTKKEFHFSFNIDTTSLDTKTPDEKKIIQKIIQRLNHLDYQEKEEFAAHGYHSFGFGYPLIIKRDPNNKDKIIKAPLLIWYLTIEKNTTRNNTWTISRKEEQPIIFNELLQSHLESAEKIKTDDLEELIDDELVNEQQLTNLCKLFLEKLNIPFDADDTIATILPCTNKETIELLSKESAWIRWSGVFGSYKMLKQAIIKDVENLLKSDLDTINIEQQTVPNYEGEVITPIALDPSQENVLLQIKDNNNILIQGPPGTGKSQSLTAILTLALLKGQKVLIVCEKRTAMEVLYNNLKKINLHHLSVLIEDVYTDRKQIVETARAFIENENTNPIRFRANEYEQIQAKFLSLQEELNYRIQFTKNEIFGDDNWTEVLCKSIELNANTVVLEKANALYKSLNNSQYKFSYEEFIALKDSITKTYQLLVAVNNDAVIFNEIKEEKIHNVAQSDVIVDSLKTNAQHTNALLSKIKENTQNYLTNYTNLSGWKTFVVSFLAIFSSKYRKIKEEKTSTLTHYEQLKSDYLQQAIFSTNHSFVDAEHISSTDALIPSLQNLQEKYNAFFKFENSFDTYYQYKKFLLQQQDATKNLIVALDIKNDTDYSSIFETYYLNQFILKTALENGIKANAQQLYSELEQTDTELKQKISDKINSIWQQKQQEVLAKRDVATLKYLYNQRKNKQFTTKNSLRKILHDDIEFFTTLFPIIMVNPTVSASILPLNKNNFDYIILDEASQLRLEDTFTALYRGNTKIISGDKHQMPPSNFFGNEVVFWNETEEDENDTENFLAESKSLLEFAADANYKSANLDFHYRSLHPSLIEFSNHAFYQSRLIPMPEKSKYQALFYTNVNGLYKNGVNVTEADAVVALLYSMPISSENCPSVGIATFNIHQRNLIYDKLYEVAYNDKQKSEQLQLLLNNGLFVKNLENIQGDERDIMLLSTTFGKDEDGKFKQFFGPLTQEKGYQLLNVIVTRAKHSLYVFTSIPEDVFLNFEAELSVKGNVGKSVFYAYLSYVKANAEKNNAQIDFIKNTLQKSKETNKANTNGQNDNIKSQVYLALKEIFKDDVLQHYSLGGYLLDIVLLKNGVPFLYIDFENTQNYHTDVTYRIKLHQQKIIQPYSIKLYNLWSYDWWLNKKQEIQQIVDLYHS